MHQPAERLVVSKTLKLRAAWLPYLVLVGSIGLTFVGIFVLSEWAETSGWHHAAQHVTIFLSGCGAGSSVLSMRKKNKEIK